MTTDVPSTARAAATLFVLAALGGFVLFATHLRGKLVSLPLSVVHGGVAVCGFALLVLALVG